VALRAGKSDAGRKAALSHTASMAGSDVLYETFFEKHGIVRARTFEHFLETLKLFSINGRSTGRRLAVFTCSGMEAICAADFAEDFDIELPQPSQSQSDLLYHLLPGSATIANPLDYTVAIWGNEMAQRKCFDVMMSQSYDAAALVSNYPSTNSAEPKEWDAATNAFIAASQQSDLPCYFIGSLPEGIPPNTRCKLIGSGITPLQGFSKNLRAVTFQSQPANCLMNGKQKGFYPQRGCVLQRVCWLHYQMQRVPRQ
jgi:acyl-CoA synthetase (NDP forming)